MAFTLNSVDFSTYGFIPGVAGGNVAVQGCFDLPKRIGTTYKDWGEQDGIESFTDSSEIFFEGRDIFFKASVFGSNSVVNNAVKNFYDTVNNVTGTRTFASSYGNFSVLVKSADPTFLPGGADVTVRFREPVVDLTGGSWPASGSSTYQIDGRPMTSFGLYTSTKDGAHALPEMKNQVFTKYGSEGFQPTKRQGKTLKFKAYLIGSSLADFISKVKALYLVFSSSGERQVKFNNELYVTCFADQGFQITDIYVYNSGVIATFNMELRVTLFSLTTF